MPGSGEGLTTGSISVPRVALISLLVESHVRNTGLPCEYNSKAHSIGLKNYRGRLDK